MEIAAGVLTPALDYGKRAERQRPEEPDVDPQVRFCERGRPGGRSLLDPGVTRPRVGRASKVRPPERSAQKMSCRDAGTRKRDWPDPSRRGRFQRTKPQSLGISSCRLSRHDTLRTPVPGVGTASKFDLRARHPRLTSYCRCRGSVQHCSSIRAHMIRLLEMSPNGRDIWNRIWWRSASNS